MITKKELETVIFENQIFKQSFEKLSEEEKKQVMEDVKKLTDLFHLNILAPLENYSGK